MSETARILDMGDDAMLGLLEDGRRLWLRGPCVPGDRVVFRPEGRGGVVTAILEPAPGRRPAACPHFGVCPGCALQPLPIPAQLALKARRVTEALRRLGGVIEPYDFRGIRPSPRELGYRNKLDFTVEAAEIGYTGPQGFLPIADCPLGDDRLCALIPGLRAWLQATPDHGLHRLILRVDSLRQGVHVLARGTPPPSFARHGRNFPGLLSLSVQTDWKSPLRTLWGEPDLHFHLAGENHRIPTDAFFQVNDALADVLVRTAMDWLREESADSLLDLFCGCGAFTLPAARLFPRVFGIDTHPGSGPFLAADLRGGLPRSVAAQTWDAVLTDPPRAGMPPRLIDDLLALRPARILYVSCNPATLARDLRQLRSRYCLVRAEAFDLFPQTPHVETLALLRAV